MEYASIVLICILNTVLFLGGYLLNKTLLFCITSLIIFTTMDISGIDCKELGPIMEGLISGLTLGIKSSIMIFVFIWVRASFPRIRFDQLMSFSWTILLPIIIAFVVLMPCVVYSFDIIPSNINLL